MLWVQITKQLSWLPGVRSELEEIQSPHVDELNAGVARQVAALEESDGPFCLREDSADSSATRGTSSMCSMWCIGEDQGR